MPSTTQKLVMLACLVATIFVATGCGEGAPPVDQKTVEQADRLKTIQDKSGGDWDKVSEDDKKWLMDNVTHGNETSAKMLVNKPKPPTPGGPPKGPTK